jgi:cysteine desulfurase
MASSTPASERVYLDYAATTPVRPEVRAAMDPFLSDEAFGNPSSAHWAGRPARAALEEARERIAAPLGAEPHDVVFTSGGTEADNLAVLGAALAARAAGGPFRVAVSAIEHKAVLDAAHAVEQLGGEAIMLPVDPEGAVDADAVNEALARGVAVVSVMWVNNETGVVQDIPELAQLAAAAGIPFHTDAVQALGKVPCSIRSDPVSLLALSGHKIGAPKGVGALVVRDPALVAPLLHGGGQQQGVRPGTENVAGAVGLGLAVELAAAEQRATADHTRGLREALEDAVLDAIPDARINGAGGERAPHIANLSIPGTDSGAMLMHLDLTGIACAAGSACTTGATAPSHVLTAMGLPRELAAASLRFSFSRRSTHAEVERAVAELPGAVAQVRTLVQSLDTPEETP